MGLAVGGPPSGRLLMTALPSRSRHKKQQTRTRATTGPTGPQRDLALTANSDSEVAQERGMCAPPSVGALLFRPPDPLLFRLALTFYVVLKTVNSGGPVAWYTVTKTINGRRYLYLQMTYRDGLSNGAQI